MTTSDKDARDSGQESGDEAISARAATKPATAEADDTDTTVDDMPPPKPGFLSYLLLPLSFLLGTKRTYGPGEIDPRSAQQIAVDEGKEIAVVVATAVVLVLLLRTLLFQPFTIPSASMEPNLYQGDYIIVSKWDYGISKYSLPVPLPIIKDRLFNHLPKRGDIVVFKLPSNTKIDYIKRVIGLPGDQIQVRHDQLYVNGAAVPATNLGAIAATIREPAYDGDTSFFRGDTATLQRESLPNGRTHTMQDFSKESPADDTDVFTVPADNYFMMGDNRDNSEDSRFPMETGGVGYVPAANLEGRAVLVLMSWKVGASLWKPWTWFNFHWDRFLKPLH